MKKIKQVKRRWIFIPIEVKNRELLPKIFLGAKAIKAGFGIIIGKNGMNISRDKFPKGIYFDKCLSKHKVASHEYQVNTLGNQLVSFDEEGLLFKSEEKYVSNRLTQKSKPKALVAHLIAATNDRGAFTATVKQKINH